MYPHTFLWHYLWIAPYTLQIVISVVMIRRRLLHEFPVFFTYTVFEAFQGVTLFILDHAASISARQYWEAYWISLLVTIGLRFALIYEICSHVFRQYPALEQLVRVLYRWVAVLLILVAVVVSAYTGVNDRFRSLTGVHVVSRAASLIQVGLLVFLFLFSAYFKLSWRSYVYGIALGLGIFSSVDLATSALRASLGPQPGNYVFDFITMTTYHCCVVLWLVYLLAPESSRRIAQELPADNLEQWNSELERLLLR
jgi:hypothetical protein